MKKLICVLVCVLIVCSCTNKEKEIEKKAGGMVRQARELMLQGSYEEAKDTIFAMRHRYPTALEARREGIVVLDSVELLAAEDSLSAISVILSAEEAELERLDAERSRGHNAEFYSQRTKVFHLRQECDEADAKVKFYLRKIEVDIEENAKAE